MADKKNDQNDQAAAQPEQGTPTEQLSAKEFKASLAHEPDRDLHPAGEPKRQADRVSEPVPNDAELDDPPLRSPRPEAELIRTLATGAGAHRPPDPAKYNADGTPKQDA